MRHLFDHSFTNINQDQMLPSFENRKLEGPFKLVFVNHFHLSSSFEEPVLTATRVLVNKAVLRSLQYKMKLNSNSYTVNFKINFKMNVKQLEKLSFFF
jgi:hypothetical protein